MTKDAFANLKLTPGVDQRLFATKGAPAGSPQDSEPPDRVGPSLRSAETTDMPTKERALVGTKAQMRGRTSERALSRVSYDLFNDQVLWLNRLKLDIREEYNARVTANEVVRLAVELIWADYRRRGDHSEIVRVFVAGNHWPDAVAVRNGEDRA